MRWMLPLAALLGLRAGCGTKQVATVEIPADMPPSRGPAADCPSYGGHEPSQYVLALAGGMAAKHGLKVGGTLPVLARYSSLVTEQQMRALLDAVRAGSLDVDTALERIRHMPFEDLGFAKVDHHRALRHGMPEVVFAEGKTPDQVAQIASRLIQNAPNVLVTRADAATAARVREVIPEAEYFPLSGAVRVWCDRTIYGKGKIAVVSAGTSDIPVAEEAQLTAEVMGNEVETIFDVGVAGIHRVMNNRDRIAGARVVIVCAGMEGALPSVVGGMVSCPVIAVPTSVGYGASFHGLAALLGMLNSCASNVTVVNIDNGFGAGYVASLINRL